MKMYDIAAIFLLLVGSSRIANMHVESMDTLDVIYAVMMIALLIVYVVAKMYNHMRGVSDGD